ncbi:MFS transporter [Paenibacillus pasadenensis]|uniref:Putative 3-phenylpropionic acid transporter n=1 Tax=Paenibacillus pasadenensis TaxID=217090 RepID=A0A2N5N247_9BACL|nr:MULTISPECIES: MFS transporter [Paenibacillus]PLT44393.1 putative 3-phenylpropionic acid transporter [Paenibacillus pasadenensis]QGG54881.1 MFS transporter [Paenibacillus sp. B01]
MRQGTSTLKAYNFLYFSLLAMFVSFMPVYLDQKGLTPMQIGLITGTGGFVTIIAQPLWGMISDRLRTVRKIMLLLTVCSAVIGYFLYGTASFPLLLGLAMLLYFCLMPIDPLLESLNFRTAESRGVSYGSIRTYGAFGYAVMSLAVGYIMSGFGASSLGLTFAAVGALCLLAGFLMPDADASGEPVRLASLAGFLRNRQTALFLLLIFISAVPQRVNDTFLGVYIGSLGGGPELLGQAWFLAAGSEIAVFALSFWWLRRGRELLLISIAGFFYFIRFFLSAWITEPFGLVLLQLLQIITFPVFYSAAIQYLYRIVPQEWRATGQTVLALLFFGVSGIVASYAGGWLFDRFGGQTMYVTMSGLSLLGLLLGLALARSRSSRALSDEGR